MTQFSRVLELLKERGATDIVVFGGGIIPDADIAELERMGVAKLFTPGATTTGIVDWVAGRRWAAASRSASRSTRASLALASGLGCIRAARLPRFRRARSRETQRGPAPAVRAR